tara:strand:+ start:4865 stop:6763 length:1899 start_codon:yes stop_codon:yes gene_type:complete
MNMQQAPFPMQPMAEEMARQGRFGDSMLVHMNPIEVEGLASLSPTGELTINPETGQPEAFLPILAALASSIGGSALATGIGSFLGSTALGGTLAGVAGGLGGKLGMLALKGITTEGLRAGLTGTDFDLGKAATSAATTFGVDKAVQAGAEALQGVQGFEQAATDAEKLADLSKAQEIAKGATPDALTAANNPFIAQAETARAGADVAKDLASDMSAFDVVKEGGLADIGKGLLTPSAAIPIAVGEGQRAEIERLDEMERMFGLSAEEREEDYRRNRAGLEASRYGSTSGGVGGLAEGGITSINPQNYMDTVSGVYGLAGEAPPVKRMMGGGPSNTDFNPMTASNLSGGFGLGPGNLGPRLAQQNLRGSEVITPADLEGYRPGIDPEIMYFRNPAKAETGTDTGSTDTTGTADTAAVMASSQSDNPFMAAADPAKRAEALEIINRQSVSTRKRKAAQDYLDRNPVDETTQDDIAGMRYGEAYGMQGGGETNAGMEKMLVDQTAMALMGRLSEEETDVVIKRFIDEFGIEAFQALRSQVLEGIVPGSQKEGMIQGQGGGMDDMIPGMIGDQQPVAVSPGEFIVPGDVVSGLGDGDSSAGAKELEGMMDRVRMERTGTTRQPAPIQASAGGILPA